jgi:diguanylate cyclase (GGDEF)-like protein
VLALHDELTGIGNRRAFLTRLRLLLQRRKPGAIALVLLDVDGLKPLNDRCGHQAGDELIALVGRRLAETHGAAYRIGGDEFAVLIDRASGEVLDSVLRHLEPFTERFETCGHEHQIGLSYGQARNRQNESIEDFFSRADARLRQCKKRLYGSGQLRDRRDSFKPEDAAGTIWDETDVETLDLIRRSRIS